MADDDDDALDPDGHRELVDALPTRLLPLIAAGMMTPDEARAHIRRAHQVLAARAGAVPGKPLVLPPGDADAGTEHGGASPTGPRARNRDEDPRRRGGSEGRHGP